MAVESWARRPAPTKPRVTYARASKRSNLVTVSSRWRRCCSNLLSRGAECSKGLGEPPSQPDANSRKLLLVHVEGSDSEQPPVGAELPRQLSLGGMLESR